MFNLTKRQLICLGLAALIGVPSFFLLKTVVKVNTAVMGMMVIMMPFFFLTMYEKNGQPLEVILNHMIQAVFKRPKIRPYMTDNYYDALLLQAKAEKEVENIVRFSQKERSGKQKVHHAGRTDQYINMNYSDNDNPIALKADFILSLCELIVGNKDGLRPVEKTVIDRCIRQVYQKYFENPGSENMPILGDLYQALLKQDEPEAKHVATALKSMCPVS